MKNPQVIYQYEHIKVSSWVLVKKEFKSWNLNDMIRDWMSCILGSPYIVSSLVLDWISPLEGQVKINFDGASFGNLGPAGYGCLMRDSQGSIISIKGGPLRSCDANRAKLIGFFEGLKMLKSKGFFNCSVEGDSKTAISWGRGIVRALGVFSLILRPSYCTFLDRTIP